MGIRTALSIASVVVLTVAATLPLVAGAHHSTATYDRSTMLEIDAEIVSVSWANPHTRFSVKTTSASGEEELWTLDGTAFYLLERGGVTEDMFVAGAPVTVAGYESSAQPRLLQVTNMRLEDGSEVVIWGTAPRWSQQYRGGPENWSANLDRVIPPQLGRDSLFQIWSPEDIEIFIHLNEGMELPLTEAVIARLDQLDTIDPCDPPGMPSSMATPLPIQFVDRGDSIELHLSVFETVRTVHLTDQAADPNAPPTLQGYSSGRWEGNTLVVRTERVSYPYFDDGAVPQTPNVDIVERFSLTDDGTALDYEMIVTEPATFTEPVSLTWRWVAIGEQLSPLHCDRNDPLLQGSQ